MGTNNTGIEFSKNVTILNSHIYSNNSSIDFCCGSSVVKNPTGQLCSMAIQEMIKNVIFN